jgi:hypothetical protein
LRNADGAAEKRLQIRAGLDAQVLPQKARDFFLALGDARFQAVIVNVIAVAGVAVNRVFALVQTAFKRHARDAFHARAAPGEIVFFIIEQIEKRPRDGFDDRCFARAVRARDGGRPALKIEGGLMVRFDVLQFDSCDVHRFGFQISDFRYKILEQFSAKKKQTAAFPAKKKSSRFCSFDFENARTVSSRPRQRTTAKVGQPFSSFVGDSVTLRLGFNCQFLIFDFGENFSQTVNHRQKFLVNNRPRNPEPGQFAVVLSDQAQYFRF